MKIDASIVIRSHNDAGIIGRTLDSIRAQQGKYEYVSLDNESSDGTAEILDSFPFDKRINIPAGSYVPGRVLNRGMRESSARYVVFINSDCPLQSDDAVAVILNSIRESEPRPAAVFGRQIPRPDADALVVRDTERAFGDGMIASKWLHFFSMAFSVVDREVWQTRRFNESIRYSEDIEWTWRLRQAGFRIAYEPNAVAEHSHNYTLRQAWRRHFGEGEADAQIFTNGEIRGDLLRYAVFPFGMEVLRDIAWCVSQRRWSGIFQTVPLRFVHKFARYFGYRHGLKIQHESSASSEPDFGLNHPDGRKLEAQG